MKLTAKQNIEERKFFFPRNNDAYSKFHLITAVLNKFRAVFLIFSRFLLWHDVSIVLKLQKLFSTNVSVLIAYNTHTHILEN